MSRWWRVPDPGPDGVRRYGERPGHHGVRERPTDCVWGIFEQWSDRQCTRPRGHGPEGLFCRQHGKKVAA